MEIKVSKAQLSVWEWKEKAYEDIKHLPILEQVLPRVSERGIRPHHLGV